MRKTVQMLLAIIMLAAAVLIIIDSQRIADTGTGNGAAILWDNAFENFVSLLSEDCGSDMKKVPFIGNGLSKTYPMIIRAARSFIRHLM